MQILKIVTGYGDEFTHAKGAENIATFLLSECNIDTFGKTLDECVKTLNEMQESPGCPNAGRDFYYLDTE